MVLDLFDSSEFPLPGQQAAVEGLPPAAWLTAMASLPRMGPRRLLRLVRAVPVAEAWRAILHGSAHEVPGMRERMGSDPRKVGAEWQSAARTISVPELWVRHAPYAVAALGDPTYPTQLLDDIEPPAVVFMAGEVAALLGPRAAIVGTRRCTRYGYDVAHEMGHDLAAAGVRVVSGLALGIDGAAHQGALEAGPDAAPPVAVVAGGLDAVYPRRHAQLWQRVIEAGGLILSECPLGGPAEAWRFPARNRIIAALSEVVVVVESAAKGGSLHTVRAAVDRDIDVLAVPGPVRSKASAGTNALLFDGCGLARDATDVLTNMGLDVPRSEPAPADGPRPAPGEDGRRVLAALGWEPANLESLAVRTGFELGRLSVAVAELQSAGWIVGNGLWFEQVGEGP